jgi:RNA polymerase sigma-70 factor (ECF subfamily)
MEAGLAENPTMRSIKRWLWKENGHAIPTADAFSRLYEETHLIVFRYVFALSGGPLQEAEDLTAETFARAWGARHDFRGSNHARLGWLLQIARNLAIDLSRRRKVRNVAEDVPIERLVDPTLLPELDVITREQITILWRMLGTLADDVREMLVLRYILGWQVRQIAVHLGLNENTVTVTVRRALKSLQRDWPRSQEHDHE